MKQSGGTVIHSLTKWGVIRSSTFGESYLAFHRDYWRVPLDLLISFANPTYQSLGTIKSPTAMTSGSEQNEDNDKTLRATYERLKFLGDASQILMETSEALDWYSWQMEPLRSVLSAHNHEDLISDQEWRLSALRDSTTLQQTLTKFLSADHPLASTLRCFVSDMQQSLEDPLVSR